MAERRPLHIGVDARELTGRPTGVGRYVRAILGEWTRDETLPHRLTMFAATPMPADLTFGPRVTWHHVPASAGGTWWEQHRLPEAVTATGVDVFFAAGYTAPLRLPVPFVVAIYDVSFFAHPEWFSWREGFRRRWLTRAAARRAHAVVTISDFSADEIVRYLGVDRTRIRLARPGPPASADSARRIDASRAETGVPRRNSVLYVGSLFTRRRIPDLLRAFTDVRTRVPEARLVLVGDNRTQPRIDPRALSRDLGLAEVVEWHEYVDDATLERLYDEASLFVFLSDYEGFALTPFEAIAHGAPPVLLDTPVAREVYGDAARLTSADPAAIADALVGLLQDETARQSLLAAGRQRLASLSWRDAARVILDAIEEAGGR